MPARSIRVLVVEDYEPFQHFVASILQKQPELQIIRRVSDGREAVQKAQELQPDLILLDIGLPSLNGIEVAQQIRKLSPKSKILFVSQESSADIVQGALSTGAQGYVLKSDAGRELLEGVNAVLRGEQFVGNRFSGHTFVEGSYEAASQEFRAKNPFAPLQRNREIARRHEVEFYPDDAALVVGFSHFIETALEAGDAVIVVATESHRKSLLQRLQEHGVDVVAVTKQGLYASLDVAETLSTFMVNDRPDPARCLKVASDLVMEAGKAAQGKSPRVAVCGECAPTLWAQGKADAAVQVEHLWDEMARTHEVDILCGYVLNSFQRELESHIYERICAEHSAVCS